MTTEQLTAVAQELERLTGWPAYGWGYDNALAQFYYWQLTHDLCVILADGPPRFIISRFNAGTDRRGRGLVETLLDNEAPSFEEAARLARQAFDLLVAEMAA